MPPPPPPWIDGPMTEHSSLRPPGTIIDMIVVHALAEWIWWPEELSGEPDRYVPALEWLTVGIPGRKPISAHAVVDSRGAVHRICPERRKAWHAGTSRFGDETNLNTVSLGVEVLVPGQHDYGSFIEAIGRSDCYSRIQYRALGWLVYKWMADHPRIGHDRVLAHSSVSGDDVRGPRKGKRDPGEGFDWAAMWEEVKKWA